MHLIFQKKKHLCEMSVIRLMKSATENLSLCSEEVLGYSLASEVVCPMWEKFCFSSVLREVWVDDISRQLAMSCFHVFFWWICHSHFMNGSCGNSAVWKLRMYSGRWHKYISYCCIMYCCKLNWIWCNTVSSAELLWEKLGIVSIM